MNSEKFFKMAIWVTYVRLDGGDGNWLIDGFGFDDEYGFGFDGKRSYVGMASLITNEKRISRNVEVGVAHYDRGVAWYMNADFIPEAPFLITENDELEFSGGFEVGVEFSQDAVRFLDPGIDDTITPIISEHWVGILEIKSAVCRLQVFSKKGVVPAKGESIIGAEWECELGQITYVSEALST